ncbi:hypothetical protein ACLI4R_05745 [Natrialbaceae archaeon A-chndr2]
MSDEMTAQRRESKPSTDRALWGQGARTGDGTEWEMRPVHLWGK